MPLARLCPVHIQRMHQMNINGGRSIKANLRYSTDTGGAGLRLAFGSRRQAREGEKASGRAKLKNCGHCEDHKNYQNAEHTPMTCEVIFRLISANCCSLSRPAELVERRPRWRGCRQVRPWITLASPVRPLISSLTLNMRTQQNTEPDTGLIEDESTIEARYYWFNE